jgi:phosphohistidine swiveling domain-containing protein
MIRPGFLRQRNHDPENESPVMPWRELSEFRDRSIPKLYNLLRARRAGLVVPSPTLWATAEDLERDGPRAALALHGRIGVPCIVRSGSPTEDTAATSNAGRFLSLPVHAPGALPGALARVVAALPVRDGRRRGVVFVQPLIAAVTAGITFFDGFYYEETSAPGGNGDLTAGRCRGEVRRGQIERGEPRSDWLGRVHRAFGGRLDLEWAQPDRGGRVLLQVRPALFPIRRNPTLSLANHKEVLGDPPSPWVVGVYADVGDPIFRLVARADPSVAAWEDCYAVDLAERAWMNLSPLFRLADHWGLPRRMITENFRRPPPGPLDGRFLPGRFLRSLPAMARMAALDVVAMLTMRRRLRRLDTELDAARSLLDLQRVHVRAFDFSVRTNWAIMSALAVVAKVRRALGLDPAARVVTHRMMAEYAELASRPALADRLAGLDAWLARYGHRGPLETDPIHPRFCELRPMLEADLRRGTAPPPRAQRRPSALRAALSRVFFVCDEEREWFRDQLMRRWQRLRGRILEEATRAVAAGHLDRPDDVFFLRAEDLASDPSCWRDRADGRRSAWLRAKELDLPTTAPYDAIASLADSDPAGQGPAPSDRFAGIGLGCGTVAGTAVRAEALTAFLDGRRALPESPILVAPSLEPSWAVVFPRFAAVVADLGGELSHAAILLREAGIPAVVNARGAFAALADGDRIRVDARRGLVTVESHAAGRPAAKILNKAS